MFINEREGVGMITESELEQRYVDMLDDVFGTVDIAGCEYDVSRVLKEVDPIRFHVDMSDFADVLIRDGDIDGVEGW